MIENEGDIKCEYEIIPYDTPFGSKFQFESNEGTLETSELGKKQKLGFYFCSDILGEFSETFRIHLRGSSEILPLVLKGHVMAPSFEFDTEEIDFKEVSFNFKNTHIVKMRNTSEVPIDFTMRVPGDGKLMKKEFDIIPPTGHLEPSSEINIQVDFTPVFVREYEMVLVVDIEGVG
jgi:hydrocephalus-inducing protein